MSGKANGVSNEKRLGEILDALEAANQNDVYDYTGGHLNESHLPKPKGLAGEHSQWEGSKKKLTKTRELATTRPRNPKNNDLMESTLADFSIGSDGLLPRIIRSTAPTQYPNLDDSTFVEELDPSTQAVKEFASRKAGKTWATEDEQNGQVLTKGAQRTKNLEKLKNNLVVANGITKQDAYKEMRLFEENVLRKHEAHEQHVMTGEMAVKYLEDKLHEDLQKIGTNYGTTFHRLQTHSSILDELIENSPLFGFILKRIKSEYDSYVSYLLDNQPTQSHVLQEQAKSLTDKGISKPKALQTEKAEVDKLEEEGKKLLNINDRLREETEKEKEFLRLPQEPELPRRVAYREEQQINLADQLEDLHATILEKMDKINELKERLREEYVPTIIIQQLEQCVKETELEIQKLLKQNEFLEKNIEEMEFAIQDAVKNSETSERDRQRLWVKVNQTRVSDCKKRFSSFEEYTTFLKTAAAAIKTNLTDPFDAEDSSSDEDEAETNKWDWYIS